MRDFHGRAEAPRRRRNEIELDITPLLQRAAEQQCKASAAEQNGTDHEAGPLSLTTPLGISRFDPFFQYPISMSRRERELYDHSGR